MTWLAMALFHLLFPGLPSIMTGLSTGPPTSTSKIYLKIIGFEAAELMTDASAKMKAAIECGSQNGHKSADADETLANLMQVLSRIWLLKIGDTGFKEQPNPDWLKSYLSNS